MLYPGAINPKDGVFDSGGLEPGDYTLELCGTRVYRNFVYQGTIHVEEGQEQVLDIRLPTVPLYRVKGVIEVPEGRESETLTVIVRDDLDSRTGTELKHSGPFSIERLTPGHYTLSAMLGRGADKLYGELSLSITDHDIDAVKLKLLPTASLTATVQVAETGWTRRRMPNWRSFRPMAGKRPTLFRCMAGSSGLKGCRPGDIGLSSTICPRDTRRPWFRSACTDKRNSRWPSRRNRELSWARFGMKTRAP